MPARKYQKYFELEHFWIFDASWIWIMGDDLNNVEDQTSIGNIWQIRTNKYRICTELSQGIFLLLFLILVLQNCWILAAEILQTFFSPAAEELQNHLQMLCFIVLQTCNRDAADLLQRCCRPTAALLQRSCRITCRCYIPNLKSLGQVFVLECCRPAAVLLQRCCRPAAALLQRSCRITKRWYIPNLKSPGQELHVLECCRTSAGLLQRCYRTAADHEGTLSRDAACQIWSL